MKSADISNIINLGIFGVTFIAAVVAWLGAIRARNAANEANRIQQEFLAIQQTPHLSATKVELHEEHYVFVIKTDLTNLGLHSAHFVKAGVYGKNDELLGLSDFSAVIANSQRLPDAIKVETTSLRTSFVDNKGQGHFTSENRAAVNLQREATAVSFFFRYGPIPDVIYEARFTPQNEEGMLKDYLWHEKRLIMFDAKSLHILKGMKLPERDD